MESCLYEGRVRHRRFGPVTNCFSYRVFYVYLDLAELDEVFRGRWLWSAGRPAPVWFRRADFLGDPRIPLDEAVRNRVEQETGVRPGGPIRLLAHLRHFGYSMNPVSFYYCYRPGGSGIEWIVAEINNTPWNERHSYVLRASQSMAEAPRLRFRFGKSFHVSPFLGMRQDYDWRFLAPGPTLAIHMENFEAGRKMLDATLTLERRPISGATLARAVVRFPLMTVSVITKIYWQALRLWWKKAPFHAHPKPAAGGEEGAVVS